MPKRRLRHPPRWAAQPRWRSRCQPRARSLNAATGEKLWDGERSAGATSARTGRILEVPALPPGALLARRGGPSARARLRGVGAIPGEGPRAPPAPPAAGSFPSEQMGQGSGGRRRRRAEKAIFSRYIFYKSNILCISALPVKASRAQPRDSAAEPVSQQRLAATWLLAGGRAGRRGPPCTGSLWGAPPTHRPAAPSQGTIPAANAPAVSCPLPPSCSSRRGGTGRWARTPCCSPAALHSWKLNILAKHQE